MAQIEELYIEKSTKTVFILNKNLLNIFKNIFKQNYSIHFEKKSLYFKKWLIIYLFRFFYYDINVSETAYLL